MAKLARSSGIQFGIQIVQTAIGFVAIVFLARFLGSDTLGKYFLVMAVVSWLQIPCLSVHGAMSKRVSEGDEPDAFFTAGLITLVTLCLLLSAVTLGAHQYIREYVGFPATKFVVAIFFLNVVSTFMLAALRSEQKLDIASFYEGGWYILQSLSQVGLAAASVGLLSLLIGEIVAAVVTIAVAFYTVSLSIQRVSRDHFRSLYEFGKYTWAGAIKTRSFAWMDTIVLGFFVSASSVGIYEIAWRISALLILLPSAMAKVSFPDMSQHASAGDLDRVEETLRRAITFAGLLAFPGVIGVSILGTDVLRIYGPEFAAGFWILVILATARIAQSFEILLMSAINALDKPDRSFRISVLFIALNVTLNVLLVSRFDEVGAAVATVISISVSAGMAYKIVASEIRLNVSHRSILSQLVSAAVMGLSLVILRTVWLPESSIGIVAQIIVAAGVYFSVVSLASSELRSLAFRIVAMRSE
ncbi:lipopolysaccharide biosynthesis protein [Haloplanus pelagicus]|uniref:lipopolysaccharide biosynthesis protein n=1 Tax=Haloplanus pelagicus TaxID=2949995 RepID=UPI0020402259|nr:oligosaccharide flippase family protein [Haloplanus sp. HW8-1]